MSEYTRALEAALKDMLDSLGIFSVTEIEVLMKKTVMSNNNSWMFERQNAVQFVGPHAHHAAGVVVLKDGRDRQFPGFL